MKRSFYFDTISNFCSIPLEIILGILASNNEFSLELTQREAWRQEIVILKKVLSNYQGSIFFEYSIPRMGKRIDVVLIIQNTIFVLEFKIGEKDFLLSAVDQVLDYALDLKNFHETSHQPLVAPILIATAANDSFFEVVTTPHNDNVLFPIKTNVTLLDDVIKNVLLFADGSLIDTDNWITGRYSPTPTIVEAAMALYNGHDVEEISRTDAGAMNLSDTSNALTEIIFKAKNKKEKAICFVTGVPGAGKTLVGLNIATKHVDRDISSVFLSGNGPLVAVLREALTRDKFKREKALGNKIRKGEIMSEVKLFIQNVHHFRDECLRDKQPPFEHVAIFDEAQRAWNHLQTANFMQRKKNTPNFTYSEPEFLISCLDRHQDWGVVICLVGGGQEINTGEAGISEWIESINRSFPNWHVYISDRLTDSEYAAGNAITLLEKHEAVETNPSLHLSVSLRSFRAEHLSLLIKNMLDLNMEEAKANYAAINDKYPIVLTRDLATAKKWLKEKARGTERYGIVVSSQAQRLKPYAIDVKS
ncbi:MAG: DNA/RNA helicase domain-containing protein, partial [Parafilimonas sp.]